MPEGRTAMQATECRFGVCLVPEFYELSALTTVAREAESQGLDHVYLSDHREGLVGGDGALPMECFAALSALAVTTSSIGLGSLVAAVPARSSALLAQSAVTIDRLSEGRMALGIGYGWHDSDIAATAQGTADEAALTKSAIDAVQKVRGIAGDSIPITVGGASERAQILALTLKATWSGFGPPERFRRGRARLETHSSRMEAGRLRTSVLLVGSSEISDIPAYLEMGVSEISLLVLHRRQLRLFARAVRRWGGRPDPTQQ
jgi:alkanesulfonate monooxygenase SsuD/methylene tetrahydromethanopterin reductase-like flavin-dependent oxidoreductase (luciferase family)